MNFNLQFSNRENQRSGALQKVRISITASMHNRKNSFKILQFNLKSTGKKSLKIKSMEWYSTAGRGVTKKLDVTWIVSLWYYLLQIISSILAHCLSLLDNWINASCYTFLNLTPFFLQSAIDCKWCSPFQLGRFYKNKKIKQTYKYLNKIWIDLFLKTSIR